MITPRLMQQTLHNNLDVDQTELILSAIVSLAFSITGVVVANRKSKKSRKPSDQKLSALRADLDALQDDMKNVVGDVGNVASGAAQAAVASAREIAERAYRLAHEARETVADEFEEWSDENLESMRDQIRSKPMAAVALSLIAGLIVGAILLRR